MPDVMNAASPGLLIINASNLPALTRKWVEVKLKLQWNVSIWVLVVLVVRHFYSCWVMIKSAGKKQATRSEGHLSYGF